MTINHSTSTLNWDTVFAIPISEANRMIREHKSSPEKFELDDGDQNNFKGEFKDWQISIGGDGNSIRMKIPVLKFTTIFKDDDIFSDGEYGFQSADLYVQVKLNYLPHEKSAKNTGNEKLYDLKMKTTSSNPVDPAVIGISLKNMEGLYHPGLLNHNVFIDLEDILKEIFMGQIITWLTLNLATFNHTFNVVNLNQYISEDEPWSWCKPSYVDYAYTDIEGDVNKSLLGVLCMTGGRKGGIQQQQKLDAYVIPKGSNAGFLIAQERYLKNVLLRTLLMRFKNSKSDDYEIINASGETGKYQYSLQLKDNRAIQLEKIEGSGGVFTPFLKELKISLVGEEMRMESYTETPISAGVTAWCRTTHNYRVILTKNKKGEQTISYEKTNEPTILKGTDKDPSEIIDIAKILLIIGGTILGVMTGGATSIIIGIIVGILYGVLENLPQLIAMYNRETSPGIDLMLKNTTSQIKWNASKTFELDYAGLAGPLQLGGKFVI